MTTDAGPAGIAAAGSLRQGLAIRLALVLLLTIGALSAVVSVVTGKANAAAAEQQLGDAALFIERRLAALDRSWMTQAEQLLAQLEFAHVLDERDDAQLRARLTAYFAVLGGEGMFTHVLLLRDDGTPLVRFRSRSQQDLDPPPNARTVGWVYAERDATVYRSIAQPAIVAGRPARIVVFAPLDRAAIAASSYPGSTLELRWHGQVLVPAELPSASMPAGAQAQPLRAARELRWAGDPEGPTLVVSRPPSVPLSREVAMGVAALGGLAVAVVGWLVLGRWLSRHAQGLAALQAATTRFSAEQRVTPEVSQAIAAAAAGGVREVAQLAHEARSMMGEVERAQAVHRRSRAVVEEANASLEARVQARTRDLELARDEALSATRAKEQFLANVSHELRTPLAGMLGSLELIEADVLPAQQRAMLDVARSSGQALLALINELLDFSKIEAGKLDLAAEPVEPLALADEVVRLFSATAIARGLALRTEFEGVDEELRVLCDGLRLRQVLLNLTGNAIKFTERGAVTLRISVAEREGDRATVRFGVQDSGVGISEADRARIFMPFVQGSASVQRGAFAGTGLGLAISQRLVEAMGGRIELESGPGVGSLFHFSLTLPLAGPGVARAESAEAGATPSYAPLRGRVLLVDDNLVNRLVAGEMLRRLGVDVAEAENGREALERVAAEDFDVVLMDCLMPVLDGYGASRAIRERERRTGLPHLPICALTANAMPGDVERCLESGMDAHLPKPFTLGQLHAALAGWLAEDAPNRRRAPVAPA